MRETNWYVITGAPCSGKTTVIRALQDLGYQVVHEAARACIEKKISLGATLDQIKSDMPAFQRLILYEKIRIEKDLPPDQIIFLDRAIPDSIAYFQCSGMDIQEPLSAGKKVRYKKVFLFERFDFSRDRVRLENNAQAARLEQLLKQAYQHLSYETLPVPALTVRERVALILKHLEHSDLVP